MDIVQGEPIPFGPITMGNGATNAPGKSPIVVIRKAGQSFAAPVGSRSDLGNGWYELAGNQFDTDTCGALIIHADTPGCDPFDFVYRVVPQTDPSMSLVAVFGQMNLLLTGMQSSLISLLKRPY